MVQGKIGNSHWSVKFGNVLLMSTIKSPESFTVATPIKQQESKGHSRWYPSRNVDTKGYSGWNIARYKVTYAFMCMVCTC